MLDAASFADTQHAGLSHPGPCYGYGFRTGWIVAVTHVQAERWAAFNLTHRGYHAFLPLHAVRRRDRVLPTLRHTVLVPLFRGYLFVAYDSREPRRPIRETPGVRDLIRTGREVAWCPEGLVETLQATEDARRSTPAGDTLPRPGAPCELNYGPFQEQEAVLLALRSDRAIVAICMLGGLRELSVPLDCLAPRE